MTLVELQSRAIDRARTERLHTFKVAGRNSYLVRSRQTEPGAMREVRVDRTGTTILYCSCAGWLYRQSCTHAAAVSRRVARESRKAVSA